MAELLDHYKKRQVEDRLSGGSQSRHGSGKQPPRCYSVRYEPYNTDGSLNIFHIVELCSVQKGREVFVPDGGSWEGANQWI